jgi:hypothetical protein
MVRISSSVAACGWDCTFYPCMYTSTSNCLTVSYTAAKAAFMTLDGLLNTPVSRQRNKYTYINVKRHTCQMETEGLFSRNRALEHCKNSMQFGSKMHDTILPVKNWNSGDSYSTCTTCCCLRSTFSICCCPIVVGYAQGGSCIDSCCLGGKGKWQNTVESTCNWVATTPCVFWIFCCAG